MHEQQLPTKEIKNNSSFLPSRRIMGGGGPLPIPAVDKQPGINMPVSLHSQKRMSWQILGIHAHKNTIHNPLSVISLAFFFFHVQF